MAQLFAVVYDGKSFRFNMTTIGNKRA